MKASFSASVPCSARWSWSPLRPPNDASNSRGPDSLLGGSVTGWGPDSLLGGSGAVAPALTFSGPRRLRQFRLRWPGLRQRKQAFLAISSARSTSVRGLDPLRPKSLATYRVSWVGSLWTFRLSSIDPASTSMGMTWFRQLLLWLAGEYWGWCVEFAALWAGVR